MNNVDSKSRNDPCIYEQSHKVNHLMTMVATRHDDGRQKLFFLTPTCLDSKNNGSYLIKLSSQVRGIE